MGSEGNIGEAVLARLAALTGEFRPGTVSLVGAGPGDSTLVTVRGAVRISQADVVLHDKLVGPELLALVSPRAQRFFVGKWRGSRTSLRDREEQRNVGSQESARADVTVQTPLNPPLLRGEKRPWTQEQINAAMIEHARAGRRVVRLKGGDPLVFGRGGEECEALAAAGVPFEVVPGITAAFGAPAYAGIPLTHRGLSRSFALVTGHFDPDVEPQLDFAALSRMETLAIYMGVKHLAGNCQHLIAAGMKASTPAAVIEWGTRPGQRTIVGTLADIAERMVGKNVHPPALVLIGEVVGVRERIEWFEKRPLHGQVIVVTRMRDQAAALCAPLAAAGAEVIEAPTIELAPMEEYAAVDAALRNLGRYAWLVVTSTNGVDALFARIEALRLDARALAGIKIAAVGPATAEGLGKRGIRADLVPSEAVGEVLADALIDKGAGGRHVLLLRGDLAREALPAALRARGAECDDLPVYRTVCPARLPEAFLAAWDAGRIDWITLTSPSSFVNLLELLGEPRIETLRSAKLASIGPVTTKAIRELGFQETVEAQPHDVGGMVTAITRAVEEQRSSG